MKLEAYEHRRNFDNLLPLINIVFLLLIFVLLMARLEPADLFEVTPPASTSDEPAGQREALLLLAADGRVAVSEGELSDEALAGHVARLLADEPDLIVKIKADAAVDAMRLIEVMEILRAGGVSNLVLLTEKRS